MRLLSPNGGGFVLKSNSRAIDAGINFITFLDSLSQSDTAIQALVQAFPDFDWTLDLAGHKRGEQGAWDIGAYEYVSTEIRRPRAEG